MGRDDTAVPADGTGDGDVTEILLGDLGLGAPAQEMVAGMGGDGDGVVEAGLELRAKGGVAGRVDREVGVPTGSPVVRGVVCPSRRVGVDCDGDGGGVAGLDGRGVRREGQQQQCGCGQQVGDHGDRE